MGRSREPGAIGGRPDLRSVRLLQRPGVLERRGVAHESRRSIGGVLCRTRFDWVRRKGAEEEDEEDDEEDEVNEEGEEEDEEDDEVDEGEEMEPEEEEEGAAIEDRRKQVTGRGRRARCSHPPDAPLACISISDGRWCFAVGGGAVSHASPGLRCTDPGISPVRTEDPE